MTATRFEPSAREVSETLTALVVMGPWGIDGLYDYFDDEFEWKPFDDSCVDCRGTGYRENYRECKTCKTSGSLLVALHLRDMREAPEPYLGSKLREQIDRLHDNAEDNDPFLSEKEWQEIFGKMAEDAHTDPALYN